MKKIKGLLLALVLVPVLIFTAACGTNAIGKYKWSFGINGDLLSHEKFGLNVDSTIVLDADAEEFTWSMIIEDEEPEVITGEYTISGNTINFIGNEEVMSGTLVGGVLTFAVELEEFGSVELIFNLTSDEENIATYNIAEFNVSINMFTMIIELKDGGKAKAVVESKMFGDSGQIMSGTYTVDGDKVNVKIANNSMDFTIKKGNLVMQVEGVDNNFAEIFEMFGIVDGSITFKKI